MIAVFGHWMNGGSRVSVFLFPPWVLQAPVGEHDINELDDATVGAAAFGAAGHSRRSLAPQLAATDAATWSAAFSPGDIGVTGAGKAKGLINSSYLKSSSLLNPCGVEDLPSLIQP